MKVNGSTTDRIFNADVSINIYCMVFSSLWSNSTFYKYTSKMRNSIILWLSGCGIKIRRSLGNNQLKAIFSWFLKYFERIFSEILPSKTQATSFQKQCYVPIMGCRAFLKSVCGEWNFVYRTAKPAKSTKFLTFSAFVKHFIVETVEQATRKVVW